MSPDLRPAESLTVKSIKDLKRELDELIGSAGGCYDDGIRDALELLNSFEAGLRERITECEKQATLCKQNELYHDSSTFLKLVDELLIILGEGGGSD